MPSTRNASGKIYFFRNFKNYLFTVYLKKIEKVLTKNVFLY